MKASTIMFAIAAIGIVAGYAGLWRKAIREWRDDGHLEGVTVMGVATIAASLIAGAILVDAGL